MSEHIPTWGYNKDGGEIFDLKPGESLPDGYVPNPAMVKGSAAEKAYRADAEKEGAPVPWDQPSDAAKKSKSATQ
jgi:hypothetical protein